jgi:heat shock protein HtpX
MPRLYLIPSEQPNACATGRNPRNAAVAVTAGLLEQLPPERVKAVAAHELGHVRNRDILVSSIAAMVAAAISAIAKIAAMLLQLGVSRQREHLADATAAQLLGEGRPLADALESLERGIRAEPTPVNPAIASLYIANPLPRTGLSALFATHPPVAERVRRLRAYDGRAEIGFPA